VMYVGQDRRPPSVNTPSGSVVLSLLLSLPSRTCGAPSRSTTSLVLVSFTAVRTRPSRLPSGQGLTFFFPFSFFFFFLQSVSKQKKKSKLRNYEPFLVVCVAVCGVGRYKVAVLFYIMAACLSLLHFFLIFLSSPVPNAYPSHLVTRYPFDRVSLTFHFPTTKL